MKKRVIISIFIVFIILILISFWISFNYDKKIRENQNEIKDYVVSYLNKKYNEKFDVIDFVCEKNSYDIDNGEDYITKVIDSSYIYTLTISSSRLINFKVIYVVYENEDDYISNKKYNIMKSGIYENYIYEYKMRDIRKEIRNEVMNIVSNFDKMNVSMDNLMLGIDNILINYSLDNERKELYEEYNKLNKSVSNLDFYNLYLKINNDANLILDIVVNDYIDSSNVSEFKNEVRSLVLYLEELGYINYDINFKFDKYESARVTKYFDDDEEKIYLVFDYEGFSDVSDSDKLTAIILDK